MRKIFRLPRILTVEIRKIQPKMPMLLIKTVVKFGSIGVPSAIRICIIYGSRTVTLKCVKKDKQIIRINGRLFRRRRNSLILSRNVDFEWLHRIDCLAHETHALDVSLYFCSSVNSWWTVCGETQPRSHCNDFWASFGRPFDKSQLGDSGTYSIVCKSS